MLMTKTTETVTDTFRLQHPSPTSMYPKFCSQHWFETYLKPFQKNVSNKPYCKMYKEHDNIFNMELDLEVFFLLIITFHFEFVNNIIRQTTNINKASFLSIHFIKMFFHRWKFHLYYINRSLSQACGKLYLNIFCYLTFSFRLLSYWTYS